MGPILAMDISFWHMFFWLCWSYSLLVTLSVCYIECWVSLGILGIQNKQCNDCIVHYVVCNFTVEKYLQVIKDYLQSPEWVSNFLPSEESSTWLAEISCIEAMPSCQSSWVRFTITSTRTYVVVWSLPFCFHFWTQAS